MGIWDRVRDLRYLCDLLFHIMDSPHPFQRLDDADLYGCR